MRILLVWAAADFSIRDVTVGYRGALLRAGHEVYDYRLDRRITMFGGLLAEKNPDVSPYVISAMASENIVVEASKHDVELIVVISGLACHPDGIALARKHGFPIAVVFTESPYADDDQAYFARFCDVVTTNDRWSAQTREWAWLPPAYDPDVHRPVPATETCDVLMVGTGWKERIAFLEAIDWTGIDLRLRGLWPDIVAGSLLARFYREGCIENDQLPGMYAGAKVCLNFHRAHPKATTPNPRTYEIAACGAFQLSDVREDLLETFGLSVPTFTTPASLEMAIRYYLTHESERRARADLSRRMVASETFDRRVDGLMVQVGRHVTAVAV